MAEEIQKFDPSAAVDKLRERVRAMFADIFPPEQLDAMIKRELTAWMTPGTRDVYNDRRVEAPSGFQTIVRSVLEEQTRTKLKEWLSNSPEWAAFWSYDNGTQAGGITPVPSARAYDLMAEALAKELPNVLSTILKSFVASTVNEMKQRSPL